MREIVFAEKPCAIPRLACTMTQICEKCCSAGRTGEPSFRSSARSGAEKWPPGMALSILSNIAREAPLGSLLVAFLLGVAFARRR
jgi:hypothetical protein